MEWTRLGLDSDGADPRIIPAMQVDLGASGMREVGVQLITARNHAQIGRPLAWVDGERRHEVVRKGEGGRMWPFFSGKKEKEPEGTQERLDRIETAIRRLQEEWTDVYAKFRTMQMRVAKQVQRSEQASSQPEEPGNGGSAELMVGANPIGSTLSPRQQQVQQQIMARRNRRLAGLPGNGSKQEE